MYFLDPVADCGHIDCTRWGDEDERTNVTEIGGPDSRRRDRVRCSNTSGIEFWISCLRRLQQR